MVGGGGGGCEGEVTGRAVAGRTARARGAHPTSTALGERTYPSRLSLMNAHLSPFISSSTVSPTFMVGASFLLASSTISARKAAETARAWARRTSSAPVGTPGSAHSRREIARSLEAAASGRGVEASLGVGPSTAWSRHAGDCMSHAPSRAPRRAPPFVYDKILASGGEARLRCP